MQLLEKARENVRKHRDIKLVIIEGRRNYLVSEPNCYTTKIFTEHLLAIEREKTHNYFSINLSLEDFQH